MRIYLDNNATTELDLEVFDTVVQSLSLYGNPSSAHYHGQQAKNLLIKARAQVAAFFKVKPKEVIFTSSGTEANNLLLRGVFGERPRGHIITSNVEHASVYNTIKVLEKNGCSVTYLDAGKKGGITREQVEEAITSETRLISLIAVNNETGVRTDIDSIAALASVHAIPFMVDAVCSIGKEECILPAGVAYMSVSGHKFHAPKGIGCAIIREKYKIVPCITGGPQEWGYRGGTENIPAIMGFAKALQLIEKDLKQSTAYVKRLRDDFEKQLCARLPDIAINGMMDRIANTSNIMFDGVDGEALLIKLDLLGLSVSHGAACASGAREPSRVLLNMGLTRKEAGSSIRFSLSKNTTQDEIDTAVEWIVKSVEQQRKM